MLKTSCRLACALEHKLGGRFLGDLLTQLFVLKGTPMLRGGEPAPLSIRKAMDQRSRSSKVEGHREAARPELHSGETTIQGIQ
jgi:hypothetical protein